MYNVIKCNSSIIAKLRIFVYKVITYELAKNKKNRRNQKKKKTCKSTNDFWIIVFLRDIDSYYL